MKIAITGLGMVTPAGRGHTVWEKSLAGALSLTKIDASYFDSARYTCQIAGQVPPHVLDEPEVLSERMVRQTDRCSQIALVAALDALQMAQLPRGFLPIVPPERVGLMVGTAAAGWSYLEREMQHIYTRGVTALDRFGLTAGFPAGPQGHIGIYFGVQGRSCTFVSERVAGAHAIIEAARTIERGSADIVLAGGTDAPLSPLLWSAFSAAHLLQASSTPTTFRPLAPEPKGMLLGEGSTFLVLEEYEHARRRGVPILALLNGCNTGNDMPARNQGHKLPGFWTMVSIQESLDQARIEPKNIAVIFPHGSALAAEDETEIAALTSFFADETPITIPKAGFGHLLAAATPTDIALAILTLRSKTIPPTPDAAWRVDLNIVSKGTTIQSQNPPYALILAGGYNGPLATLVISVPDYEKDKKQ